MITAGPGLILQMFSGSADRFGVAPKSYHSLNLNVPARCGNCIVKMYKCIIPLLLYHNNTLDPLFRFERRITLIR